MLIETGKQAKEEILRILEESHLLEAAEKLKLTVELHCEATELEPNSDEPTDLFVGEKGRVYQYDECGEVLHLEGSYLGLDIYLASFKGLTAERKENIFEITAWKTTGGGYMEPPDVDCISFGIFNYLPEAVCAWVSLNALELYKTVQENKGIDELMEELKNGQK